MLADPEDRADAINDFTCQSKLKVEELSDAMQFSWKKLKYGALFPLVGSGIQWATPTDSKLVWAGNALSFVGAAHAALTAIGGLNETQRKQPLAYIAHARRLAVWGH
ncbi:hypothetical protein [Paraburkholderia sp. RL18-085-BIA-A]|uniref:hypothetical protein n=1 Tax=Paraburkholderia sp. RL18-085-BIA-A TaxID=3031633 RepID=UPI0038BB97A7